MSIEMIHNEECLWVYIERNRELRGKSKFCRILEIYIEMQYSLDKFDWKERKVQIKFEYIIGV